MSRIENHKVGGDGVERLPSSNDGIGADGVGPGFAEGGEEADEIQHFGVSEAFDQTRRHDRTGDGLSGDRLFGNDDFLVDGVTQDDLSSDALLPGDQAGQGVPEVGRLDVTGADAGVNIDSDGTLHGLAWGENIGWVNFDGGALATPPRPARIDCATPPGQPLARLTGFVWGENVGWINLDDLTPGKFVSVDAATAPIDCDMDHDGVPNGNDIALFVEYLMNSGADWRDVCSGDLETPPDGTIDLDDVTDFVACLVG